MVDDVEFVSVPSMIVQLMRDIVLIIYAGYVIFDTLMFSVFISVAINPVRFL